MEPLISAEVPTWRDIIIKVLRTSGLDAWTWSDRAYEELADDIMAELRKSARSRPLE
jgi:hypothetical protein